MENQSKLTYKWVSTDYLSVSIFIICAFLFTSFMMLMFYVRTRKDKIQLSNQIKIHVIVWTIAAFICFNFFLMTFMINSGYLGLFWSWIKNWILKMLMI